jgi:PKD repeat protein
MNSLSFSRAARVLRAGRFFLGPLIGSVAASNAQPVLPIQLPAAAKGARAIEVLGDRLPDVAKAYGLEAQELVTLFQTQPSLGVDSGGALIVACASPAIDPNAAAADATLVTGAAITPTSSTSQLMSGTPVDAFQLHSLPGASRVIYLDFDGHTTSGTSWNSSYAGGKPIVSQPFDLDGDPTTFSSSERAMIQGIWKRVSEDYAPFAIDVTTQDPGLEALRRTSNSDSAYGIRVVISPTNFISTSYAGYGYIGSFNWDSDTPCFCFTDQLLNVEKYIAENVSHESGHTLGLYHDGAGGSSPTEYFRGHGDWAPIMGDSYYRPITQFSKGEYANANNQQDDLAVIATFAPLMTDDHGNTVAAATVLTGPNVANGGTIESRTDVDVFRFDTGDGGIALSIKSPTGEPDLYAKAELLNSYGEVLQTVDSATGNITFAPSLVAGTYFLRISGVGFGEPATTGYTDYASLGNYVITGSLVAISGKQAPIAKASASTTSGTASLTVAFSGQNSTDADGNIVSYFWDFGNGATSNAINPSYTYNAVGTFITVLTVTDNDGMANSASVAINVTAPANVAPTAVASANMTSGLAPLAINFSSAGSVDADGSIASYNWNFGDGTTSTSVSPVKSYAAPGKYSVILTVTDNAGASASSSVAISVVADSSSAAADVHQFTLSTSSTNAGMSAIGTILVLDRGGRAVPGATITVQWSGLVSGKTTGKTDAAGKLLITSGRSKKKGTITGTISAVTLPAGMVYDPTISAASATASIDVN